MPQAARGLRPPPRHRHATATQFAVYKVSNSNIIPSYLQEVTARLLGDAGDKTVCARRQQAAAGVMGMTIMHLNFTSH